MDQRRMRQGGGSSPWDIGAAHWDQRDLYTRNADIAASGYARGPSRHPDIGSYAYQREPRLAQRESREPYEILEREAWPTVAFVPGEYEARLPPRPRDMPHGASRGPKHYRRSDARILEDVCDALAAHGALDATDIEVKVEDSEVTLEGTVRTRYEKRLAEEIADGRRDVRDVHNRLEVRPDDTSDAGLAFAAPLGTLAT
jgi:hypothetical protein